MHSSFTKNTLLLWNVPANYTAILSFTSEGLWSKIRSTSKCHQQENRLGDIRADTSNNCERHNEKLLPSNERFSLVNQSDTPQENNNNGEHLVLRQNLVRFLFCFFNFSFAPSTPNMQTTHIDVEEPTVWSGCAVCRTSRGNQINRVNIFKTTWKSSEAFGENIIARERYVRFGMRGHWL